MHSKQERERGNNLVCDIRLNAYISYYAFMLKTRARASVSGSTGAALGRKSEPSRQLKNNLICCSKKSSVWWRSPRWGTLLLSVWSSTDVTRWGCYSSHSSLQSECNTYPGIKAALLSVWYKQWIKGLFVRCGRRHTENLRPPTSSSIPTAPLFGFSLTHYSH